MEAVTRHDGEEQQFAGAISSLFDLNVLSEVGAVFEEPFEPDAEALEAVEHSRIDDFDGEERDDSDHRTEAHGQRGVTWLQDAVVVETVFLVPEARFSDGVDAIDDLDEVFKELGGNVFVNGVFGGEFDGDGEHDAAIERHPCGAVGLGKDMTFGQGFGSVEQADVIEAEESACEDVASVHILAVDPPSEVDEEFEEAAFEEGAVSFIAARGDFVDPPTGPCVDGWIDVVEVPLVGGEFSGRVHVPFAEEQFELAFGEVGIDFRHGQHVEGEVPRCEPRVLPFVGHGENVGRVEVLPVAVANAAASGRGGRLERVT